MAEQCNVTHNGWPTPEGSPKEQAALWLSEHDKRHGSNYTTLEACQAAIIIRGLLAPAPGVRVVDGRECPSCGSQTTNHFPRCPAGVMACPKGKGDCTKVLADKRCFGCPLNRAIAGVRVSDDTEPAPETCPVCQQMNGFHQRGCSTLDGVPGDGDYYSEEAADIAESKARNAGVQEVPKC